MNDSSDATVGEIREAKERGEKMFFTNGCFDLLHAGHVKFLEKAKHLGDRLVVGLNSDESVSRLKGPQRPVCSLVHRLVVLKGLRSVDWVIPFEEDTPLQLIKKIQPNVLVKGEDYRIQDIVSGAGDFVSDYGGEVKIVNFETDISTTAILKKIETTL